MMASADVTVLDVGHGNCCVAIDGTRAIIIDACSGALLKEFLQERGVTEVLAVFISHADEDHIAGLMTLLTNGPRLAVIYLNADSLRNTKTWYDLRVAFADSARRGQPRIVTAVTTAVPGPLNLGSLGIEVLAPTPVVAMSGVGGIDLRGNVLSANAMSAVLRITLEGVPLMLLAADIDVVGLDNLLAEHPRPTARVLVFPHHGGLPGRRDPSEFTERLCSAVEPDVVIFSIGRGRFGTPRPEIVERVRATRPEAHIACTQLSERCAIALPAAGAATYLAPLPARGRASRSCCAGTLQFRIREGTVVSLPERAAHQRFIAVAAPSALCVPPASLGAVSRRHA